MSQILYDLAGVSIVMILIYVLIATAFFLIQILILRWIFKINRIAQSLENIDKKLNYICGVVDNEVKQNNRINSENRIKSNML